MVIKKIVQLFVLGFFLVSCIKNSNSKTISVTNTLNVERLNETVELSKAFLKTNNITTIGLRDSKTKTLLITQTIDTDADGIDDVILFQPKMAAKSKMYFDIVTLEASNKPKADTLCYSRFVPERTDDYAWENDKVAFRTYGPTAQKMIEDKVPGGTLSSGIDLWLKRVSYPIINKWYAENLKEKAYYHTDHGEGYDPYHVGISRGAGGIGVWEQDTLITSKNFIAYRTITTGPLRTVFELDYAPWSNYNIKETKRISLDLGSNFSKFEIQLSPEKTVPNFTIGITLHDGKGAVILNKNKGYFGYWEKVDAAFLGVGIIINPNQVENALDYRTKTRDQTQLLIQTNAKQKMLTYYSGFAWTKTGDILTQDNWVKMLESQTEKINNPLQVSWK